MDRRLDRRARHRRAEEMLAAQPPAAEAQLTEATPGTTNPAVIAPTYDPQTGLPRYRVNVASRDAGPRAPEPANHLQPLPPVEGGAPILR